MSAPEFPDIISKISNGTRPDPPQGAQEWGLPDSLWEMTLRCLHTDPAQQPNMTEVIGLLHGLLMSSLSMEADLRDFFEVCKTQGMDGRGEKAQKFADELDEVRRTGRHNVDSSHNQSRRLTSQVFTRKNGNNI